MERRKLFIDGTPLIAEHLSGVGHVTLETTRALDSTEFTKNYLTTIFIPFNEKGKLDKYEFKNIRIKHLPYPHKILSLFARIAFSPPIDLFLGKGTYLFFNFRNWPVLFSKSITYIHDVAFLQYPEYIEPRNLKFLTSHMRRWINQTHKVVTVSFAAKEEIEQHLHVPSQKLEVILNAVDNSVFKPQSLDALKKIKVKYNLKDYVFFVSNIEPRKNIITLINAFKSSLGKEGKQLFIVGGGGWLNEPIMTAITQAQDEGFAVIKNKAYVPDEDLPALMQAAITVVVPSWHEGFGLPIIQAKLSGGNVVASDIPVLREAASLVGGNVLFFNPNRERELAELLTSIQRKRDISTLTPAGAADVGNIRSWEDATSELLAIVEELNEEKK